VIGSKVEICFFKPTGFADTHYVVTEDRGAAVRWVMALYDKEMACLNYISVDRCDIPEGAKVVDGTEIPAFLRRTPRKEGK
jgi:hypothetical protein